MNIHRPSKFISNELYVRFYKTARLYEKETKRDLHKTEKVIMRMIPDAGFTDMKNRLLDSGNAPKLVENTLKRHNRAMEKSKKLLRLEI